MDKRKIYSVLMAIVVAGLVAIGVVIVGVMIVSSSEEGCPEGKSLQVSHYNAVTVGKTTTMQPVYLCKEK